MLANGRRYYSANCSLVNFDLLLQMRLTFVEFFHPSEICLAVVGVRVHHLIDGGRGCLLVGMVVIRTSLLRHLGVFA